MHMFASYVEIMEDIRFRILGKRELVPEMLFSNFGLQANHTEVSETPLQQHSMCEDKKVFRAGKKESSKNVYSGCLTGKDRVSNRYCMSEYCRRV